MTFGWGPMRILLLFAMCTCASPEEGGFLGGHGAIELLFGATCCAETPPFALTVVSLTVVESAHATTVRHMVQLVVKHPNQAEDPLIAFSAQMD